MEYSEDAIVSRAISQRLQEDSSLIDAIVRQDIRQIRQLLQFGVNPNGHPMSVKGPPLHLAAQQGSLKCVQVLVKGGAYIDNPNGPYGPSGFRQIVTPLHVAVKQGNVGMVRLLTVLGADIDIPDRDGITVRQLVNNRKDLFRVVESAVKERNGSFCWSQASANFSDASRTSLRRGSENSGRYAAAKMQLHDSCQSISRCASRSENQRLSSYQYEQPINNCQKIIPNNNEQFDFSPNNNFQNNGEKNVVYGEFGILNNERAQYRNSMASSDKYDNNVNKSIYKQQKDYSFGDKFGSPVSPYFNCGDSSYNDSSSSSFSEIGSLSNYNINSNSGNYRDFNLINSNFKSIEINHSRNQTQYQASHKQLQQKQIQQQNVRSKNVIYSTNIQSSKMTTTAMTAKGVKKKIPPLIPKLDLSKIKSFVDDEEDEDLSVQKEENNNQYQNKYNYNNNNNNNNNDFDESIFDLNDDFNNSSPQNIEDPRENKNFEDFRQSFEFEQDNSYEDVLCLDYVVNFSQNNKNNENFALRRSKSFSKKVSRRSLSEESETSSFQSCRTFTTTSSNTNTISFIACT